MRGNWAGNEEVPGREEMLIVSAEPFTLRVVTETVVSPLTAGRVKVELASVSDSSGAAAVPIVPATFREELSTLTVPEPALVVFTMLPEQETAPPAVILRAPAEPEPRV